MTDTHDQSESTDPTNPEGWSQDSLQITLQKVIADHQQTLLLLQQTERAYSRLIPRQLLTLLERDSIVDVKLGDQIERKLTVMFSDIRDFTPLSESMTPGENFEFINSYLSQMEPVIGRHRGIIDKYMGDTIMALFTQSADDAVSGSIAVLEKLVQYNAGRARAGYQPIQVGIGLNTGMVIIGTVGGYNRMDSTVIGDAVNLSSRIEEVTKTYNAQLLISQNTLYDLADPSKYDIRFLDRIRVKGKTQPLSVYEVFDNNLADVRYAKRASRALFEEAIAYYHLREIPRAIDLLTRCIKIAPGDIPAHIYLTRCEEFLATGAHLGTGELDNPLKWRDDFKIGVGEIDAPHKRLFDKFNGFIAAGRQADQSENLDMLAFLGSHVQAHFRMEEEMMRQHNYPFLESHLQEHKRFIENFLTLTREAEEEASDPHYLSFRIQLLLFDWFTGHLAKADRHMGRHLLGGAAPSTNISDAAPNYGNYG
jgi:adenylate cyclase